LEKTVAGKESIFLGKEEGCQEGELIGKILTLQRFMNYSVY